MDRESEDAVHVDTNIRLIPYYPAYDTALAWYQDK